MVSKASLFAVFLCLAGCGSDVLPQVGHSLESVKEAYLALCPVDVASTSASCSKARDAINEAVDTYSKLNNAVPADAGTP
jgi:hypothetical protein